MYKPSFSIYRKISTSTLLLIGILVIVPLSFRLTITDTKSIQENIYDQSDAEMDKIANLDFNNLTEISKELQSSIDTTMSGFNSGFRKNPNLASEAKYLLSSSQMDIRFFESEVQLRIPNYKEVDEIGTSDQKIDIDPSEYRLIEDIGLSTGLELIGYTVVTLEFIGSNAVQAIAENPSGSYVNYFYGSNPDKWISNAPSYNKLVYKNLYDNIDLVYTLNNGQLKYDFYVYPDGNYEEIQLRWDGPVSLQQSPKGLQINVSTLVGEKSFTDSNPVNFVGTDREEKVFGIFKLIGESTYGFSMDQYDRSKILVIDPVLEFSTFLGGSGDDYGYSLAIDSTGNVYITGITWDSTTDFPTTIGAYNETHNGNTDVYMTKLAVNGSTLLYSTFLGGSGSDYGYSMTIDSTGDVYITGSTMDDTTDFPTTAGAYDEVHNGNTDVFVAKLAANGSTLLFSTFLGGSGNDEGRSLAVDSTGNAYITGITWDSTTDFPTTTGAYDETHNGNTDVFVAKLAANGSTLLYSNFFGGSGNDYGFSLAIDGNGDVYITGNTINDTTDFPTTAGAYDETPNGSWDVFVIKLAANGSTLLYSTFLGGSGDDWGLSMALDSTGNIYITGYTLDDTTDFPTTAGAYNETHNGGADAFVTKLAANGSTLLYSTFLGGSGTDEGRSVAIDSIGDVYITGNTLDDTKDFPTTLGAYDETHNGVFDVFVTKLDAKGAILLYSTFLGGSDIDFGYSMAIDRNDDVYITGYTLDDTTDFPTTAGAYNKTHNGKYDAFVTKLRLKPSSPSNIISITKIDKDDGYIFLFWYKSDDGAFPINSYNIYRGTISGSYSYLGSSFVTYFYDSSVIEDQPYYYVVTAINKLGESIFSSEYYIVLQSPSEPTVPQNVLTSTGESFIGLTWSSPADDGGYAITEYRIYRGVTSGIYDYVFVTTLLKFNDTFVDADTTYYYVITAVNAVGESVFSTELNAAVVFAPVEPQAPSPPTNLQASAGVEYVFLTWVAPSDDGGSVIVEYRVYRGESPGSYDLVLLTASTEFNDTLVKGGVGYYYTVVAVNDVGESQYSNQVSGLPISKPQEIQNGSEGFSLTEVLIALTIAVFAIIGGFVMIRRIRRRRSR